LNLERPSRRLGPATAPGGAREKHHFGLSAAYHIVTAGLARHALLWLVCPLVARSVAPTAPAVARTLPPTSPRPGRECGPVAAQECPRRPAPRSTLLAHVRSAPAQPPRVRRLPARLAGVTTVAVVAAGFSASAAEASYDPEVWDRVAQCESGGNWS